jgi:hypothetical protein
MFGRDYKYLEQSTKDNGHPSLFSNQITVMGFQDSGGSNLVYACKQGTTQSTNHIYIMAFGADKTYAANSAGYLISPSMTTSNAQKYYRAFVNRVGSLGTGVLAKPTEGFDLYVRTSSITSDATTGWNLVDETNDLSTYSAASAIQFKIQFKTISESCLPARVLGINVLYEDNTSASQFAFSADKSSATSKIFAWRFKTAFGGTVPTLRVNIYNDITGGLLVTDTTTTSASGTFEKSTNGTSWSAYNTTDKGNETTYIRYTPTSIADNVTVSAYLVLA